MATSRKVPKPEKQWLRVLGTLNEFQARVFVAQKALEEGRGGISQMSRLTGMARPTIMKGIAELESRTPLGIQGAGRVRKPARGVGEWRKKILGFMERLRASWRRRQREIR